MKTKIFTYFLVLKGLSNDDVGGGKGHRISGHTAWSWFQNRRFPQRNVGGATVVRLGTEMCDTMAYW